MLEKLTHGSGFFITGFEFSIGVKKKFIIELQLYSKVFKDQIFTKSRKIVYYYVVENE